jgi:hypothetical protein
MSSIGISIVQQSPPPGSSPRTLAFGGNVSIRGGAKRIFSSASIQVSIGGTIVNLQIAFNTTQWSCAAEPPSGIPRNQAISVTADATAVFNVILVAGEPGEDEVVSGSASMTAITVGPPTGPLLNITPIASPIITDDLPKTIRFSGTATGIDAPMSLVQYMADGGTSQSFPGVHNDANNYGNWSVTLPVPPGVHSLMFRGMDRFGTTNQGGDLHQVVEVRRATAVPDGPKTLGGAATTASITSWTRLEPQSNGADLGLSSRARVFDPLWMLARQWQMGEFQAEDAGSPVQVRLRATNAKLTRCQIGAIPTGTVQAPAYDPARTPLEPLVERRRMRAADDKDPRMLVFAIDAGLHFLRMLELVSPSKNYRASFIARLAFQRPVPPPDVTFDDATDRYIRSMVGRAPDGRILAALLRKAGPAQFVLDPTLKLALADQLKVEDVAARWLTWYDSLYSEPADAKDDAWNPSRLEYSLSVGAHLPGTVAEDLTLSAAELGNGGISWSSFDRNVTAKLGTSADQASTPIVIAAVPSPINFPGAPAPRFWEMEDASVAYGLVPVGPTDIAHLLMIEYASSYGNDWFVVPAPLPVGSITRVDSLVVTDTFGVRSLLRPLGDPALPAPNFSMWQNSDPDPQNARHVMTNHFFLAPTLNRSLDGAPTEEVQFLRDEMANVAWAIERSIESPIERAAQRYEAADAAVTDPAPSAASDLPRYLLSSTVPPNWIPLMPVQPSASDPKQSLLRRGKVLQPDGSGAVHGAKGEQLNAVPNLLLYDEEVPREGVRITRQRRASRWTDGSTWVWTSLRNQVGSGEGSSALQFDQVLEQSRPQA